MIRKYIKILTNPYKLYSILACKGFFKNEEDVTYLNKYFKGVFGKEIDWEDPKTFNEKLQWLKIYNRNHIYTTMVDKYAVKQYVANIIGEQYIIPTYGVWDTFDEIDFLKLPDQFVLKCTHDSGGVIICKTKKELDYSSAKRQIEKKLKKSFYSFGREWPYKDVKPRIIVEKYMEDSKTSELRDYKFFCFNGNVRCFKIDFDRFSQHKANYYDRYGNLIQMGEVVCPPDYHKKLELPNNLGLMVKLAEKLSASIPFLRVDFYEADGRVYFGELTFFPNSGFGRFIDDRDDSVLGSWINLPKKI